MGNSSHRNVISSMFISTAVAMVFTTLASVAAQLIDGIITSRFLGNDAYSAVSLFGPVNWFVLMLSSLLSVGTQIVCSDYMGKGKKKEAGSVLTFSVLAGLVISALVILSFILIPDTILSICGVTRENNPEIYVNMLAYMRGYAPGVPAMILVQIIGPMIVMDKGKLLFTISALVLGVVDVVGDIINVFLINAGTMGMGLATSVSVTAQLLIIVPFMLRKGSYFRPTLKGFRVSEIGSIAKAGFPSLVQSLAVNLRELFTNRINLFFAVSSVALVARGVQGDINTILFCFSLGVGRTMVSMTGLYHGVNDRDGIRQLFSFGMKFCIKGSLVMAAAVFLLAPAITGFYTSDPETASMCVFAVRCLSIGLVADMCGSVFADYLQGIGSRRLVIVLNLLDRLVLPVGCALALAFAFGSKGVLAAFTAGKILLALVIFIIICVHNRRIPKRVDDLLLLPEGFGGNSGENLYGHVANMDDVVRESALVEKFCLEQGSNEKSAMRMGLFVEEMGTNFVKHIGKGRRKVSREVTAADYRLFVNGDDFCLTLRDYNKVFDPITWLNQHHDVKPGEATGIRIVMGLAKKTSYYSAFDSNNLIIWLSMKE